MRIITSIAVCLFMITASAQDAYHFTKALSVAGVSRYGREAIYTDQLAYQLYSGTLQTPAAGKVFGKNSNGQDIVWTEVMADSLNRLRMRGGGFGGGAGGYFYLSYQSPKERTALLNVKGNSAAFVNGVAHGGDAYSSGWLFIPVELKKGLNELYLRGGQVSASLLFPEKNVFVSIQDSTMPMVVLAQDNSALLGAVVVINTTDKPLTDLRITAHVNGKETVSPLPVVAAMSTRKVPFRFNASAVQAKGEVPCTIILQDKSKNIDEKTIALNVVDASEKYSQTFISAIDGSVQYYAVTPQSGGAEKNSALFLSVHGAGVEAIGQARAYKPKDWGTLVAATNRRPRGFNWEDWGRLDALEVLAIAKQKFNPDPTKIYLTGHSMGGHGTWFLGATYPDKWAAIAPCAGYPTLKGYGSADGLIPDSARSAIEQVLLRGSNQSDVLQLLPNYKPLGVYVLHGDADRTVSVNYARQMRKALSEFHADMSYYEYPNGEHWFGDQSVDWKPIFDFFKWHTLAPDSAVHTIDFITASPGISEKYRWLSVLQQEQPLVYTNLKFTRNIRSGSVSGSTRNARSLKLYLKGFVAGRSITISIDGSASIPYTTNSNHDSVLLVKKSGTWQLANDIPAWEKSPVRYGTFKDPFNHSMVFVYSTAGSKEENNWSFEKARLDAETWYYRGNGAVDVIADKDYSLETYAGRNVILFGNAMTNRAWQILLRDCPIQVRQNEVQVGTRRYTGDDLGVYFTWPIKGTEINSVGVIGGTGMKGMGATLGNQYFAGASGFADFMVFSLDMLIKGAAGVKTAGYFDHQWKLSQTNMVAAAN